MRESNIILGLLFALLVTAVVGLYAVNSDKVAYQPDGVVAVAKQYMDERNHVRVVYK